ncbi:coniferyl aldehyde dehydrogenase [Pacificimonas sp. WHA3]|uniref:Aldehyde dehydrogenase n=1 Tax=Pacificimonas pallii TaxID=2827236 RepID=A0ABS6SCZ9_9SPHN|nr:coniferyl aldehyde dehydrogenase [Pacificimonas pallii]MBV7255722.1 coniferyl aldehyde dehydrogenase [Pacificimonas pallii]
MATQLAPTENAQAADMHDILTRQRAAATAELPVSAGIRRDRLKRGIALVLDNKDALVKAMSDDFGHRSGMQSQFTDIMSSITPMKHALKHLDDWMKPEKRKVDFPLNLLGAKARIEYQPLGVVGVISPWNFPVNLTFGPLAQIFAAGNRAMVKPSEFTPETSDLMARLAAKYFDETELAFINGGPDVGKAFSSLAFDHLIFTGATGIAKHILHAAADNLVPVTLELGGKSPVIVGESADIERTTRRVALGKMLNAGQICLAPDYMMVPRAQEQAIVDGLTKAAAEMYPTLISNDDYTSIVNGRHYERLQGLIEDAREKGADVVEVNPANEDFKAANTNKMPLHIVRNPTEDMKVMQEEIFGPILPIRTYDSADETIAYVNGNDRPLGLYYFGDDPAEEEAVLSKTVSGGVTVNDVIFHVSAEDLPFGGVGPSGMGAYHGHDGFRTFSHAKAVYTQPKIDLAKLAGFRPPYGDAMRKTLKRELKA